MTELNITEAGSVQFPMVRHAAEIGWTPLSLSNALASYGFRRSGGRIPQSLPRGRFGGELRQLHLSAAWTSHNTPAFDFAAAHSN